MDIDVVYNENCLEVLKRLGDNSVDSIVTDAYRRIQTEVIYYLTFIMV